MHNINVFVRSVYYAEIFVLLGFFLAFFTVRERLKYSLLLLMLGAFLLGIVYYWMRRLHWLTILPFLVIAFFYYRSVTNAEPLKLLYIMMVIIAYLLFSNSVFFVFEGSSYTWDWDDSDTVLYGFLTSGPLIAWVLRKKVWPSLRSLHTTGVRWVWTIPTTFIALSVVLSSSHLQSLLPAALIWPYTLTASLFAIASAIISFMVLAMLRKTEEATRAQENMRIIDAQMSIQGKRFAEVGEYMNVVRAMRHDMRHHLRMLRTLLEERRYDAAMDYLNEYDMRTQAAEAMPICSNYIIDLMVRRFREVGEDAGITMSLQIACPAEFWVSDVDLCIVVGNLLENAINACRMQKDGDRFITLLVRVDGPEMAIALDNSCDDEGDTDEARVRAGIPPSSGQGMRSITAVAQKYGGIATFERDGGVFRASVLLYQRKGD